MGLVDFLKRNLGKGEIPDNRINGQPFKIIEIGTSGTEIYSGYLNEEYLRELQGKDWADKIDQMRRSDGNVIMTLRALKLPLKSSNWFIQAKDDSEMAKMQKRLVEKAVFEDTGRSFTKTLGEILTMIDFGYSLFDITFRPKIHDNELGPYNTLKSISFRSQRTIERWNLDDQGNLISVTQMAFGDLGVNAELDPKYLLHFSPDQEGDNFEGISVLRGMYGSWLRKNHYLKLQAAGIEKYAIPTPILKVPSGKENSPELAAAIKALKCYTSGQANYLTLPDGWGFEIKSVQFDSDKIRADINAENQEMVNSILANFLLLGQSGNTGTYALGGTLSDFFGQTLQYLADHISEQFAEKIFKPIIKMNFGDVPCMVELRCDNLQDKADKAWADTIKTLKDGGLISGDIELEKYIRERYKLPVKAEVETTPAGQESLTPLQLAEKKSPKSKQKESLRLIHSTEDTLKEVFEKYLKALGSDHIRKLISEKSKLPDTKAFKAGVDTQIPWPKDYVNFVRYILTKSTVESMATITSLVPKTKKLSEFRLSVDRTKKLTDTEMRLEKAWGEMSQAIKEFTSNPFDSSARQQFQRAREKVDTLSQQAISSYESEFDLTPEQKARLKSKAEALISTHIGDLDKAIVLQYQTSLPSTDDDSVLVKDMTDRLNQVVGGPITTSGPGILASQAVNEGIMDGSESIEDEVESYTFVAVLDEDTTPVCEELDGRTFAANDPDLARFQPPLHHNCRSYLAVNLKSFKGNPDISEDKLTLSKSAQKAITLSEQHDHGESIPADPHSKAILSLCEIRNWPVGEHETRLADWKKRQS